MTSPRLPKKTRNKPSQVSHSCSSLPAVCLPVSPCSIPTIPPLHPTQPYSMFNWSYLNAKSNPNIAHVTPLPGQFPTNISCDFHNVRYLTSPTSHMISSLGEGMRTCHMDFTDKTTNHNQPPLQFQTSSQSSANNVVLNQRRPPPRRRKNFKNFPYQSTNFINSPSPTRCFSACQMQYNVSPHVHSHNFVYPIHYMYNSTFQNIGGYQYIQPNDMIEPVPCENRIFSRNQIKRSSHFLNANNRIDKKSVFKKPLKIRSELKDDIPTNSEKNNYKKPGKNITNLTFENILNKIISTDEFHLLKSAKIFFSDSNLQRARTKINIKANEKLHFSDQCLLNIKRKTATPIPKLANSKILKADADKKLTPLETKNVEQSENLNESKNENKDFENEAKFLIPSATSTDTYHTTKQYTDESIDEVNSNYQIRASRERKKKEKSQVLKSEQNTIQDGTNTQLSLWRAKLIMSLNENKFIDQFHLPYLHLIVHNAVPLSHKLSLLDALELFQRNYCLGAGRLQAGILDLMKYGTFILQTHECGSIDPDNEPNFVVNENQPLILVDGSLEIIQAMGYDITEDAKLKINTHRKEQSNICRLVLDLIIITEELKLFLCGTHPFPESINNLFTNEVLCSNEDEILRSGSEDSEVRNIMGGFCTVPGRTVIQNTIDSTDSQRTTPAASTVHHQEYGNPEQEELVKITYESSKNDMDKDNLAETELQPKLKEHIYEEISEIRRKVQILTANENQKTSPPPLPAKTKALQEIEIKPRSRKKYLHKTNSISQRKCDRYPQKEKHYDDMAFKKTLKCLEELAQAVNEPNPFRKSSEHIDVTNNFEEINFAVKKSKSEHDIHEKGTRSNKNVACDNQFSVPKIVPPPRKKLHLQSQRKVNFVTKEDEFSQTDLHNLYSTSTQTVADENLHENSPFSKLIENKLCQELTITYDISYDKNKILKDLSTFKSHRKPLKTINIENTVKVSPKLKRSKNIEDYVEFSKNLVTEIEKLIDDKISPLGSTPPPDTIPPTPPPLKATLRLIDDIIYADDTTVDDRNKLNKCYSIEKRESHQSVNNINKLKTRPPAPIKTLSLIKLDDLPNYKKSSTNDSEKQVSLVKIDIPSFKKNSTDQIKLSNISNSETDISRPHDIKSENPPTPPENPPQETPLFTRKSFDNVNSLDDKEIVIFKEGDIPKVLSEKNLSEDINNFTDFEKLFGFSSTFLGDEKNYIVSQNFKNLETPDYASYSKKPPVRPSRKSPKLQNTWPLPPKPGAKRETAPTIPPKNKNLRTFLSSSLSSIPSCLMKPIQFIRSRRNSEK